MKLPIDFLEPSIGNFNQSPYSKCFVELSQRVGSASSGHSLIDVAFRLSTSCLPAGSRRTHQLKPILQLPSVIPTNST